MTTAQRRPTEFITQSRSHPESFELLSGLAGRIHDLLQLQIENVCPEMAACLDDLLGAVYALFFATHYDYKNRSEAVGDDYIRQTLLVRAVDMSAQRVRTEGAWTAGFYFNSALFRIAAVYDRTTKIVTGSNARLKERLALVEASFQQSQGSAWESLCLKKVNCEVNKLKHTEHGIYKGRIVEWDHAIGAICELLILIEALGKPPA